MDIASLDMKIGRLEVKIGMAFSFVGIASLIGGPVGGRLIDSGDERGEAGKFL